MIEDLMKLVKELDTKVKPLVEAIEKEEPTTEKYGRLMNNFLLTMQLSTNLNLTLADVARKAQEMKEEKKDESNN
jgi:hypothetical protein